MTKKSIAISILLLAAFLLNACSGIPSATAAATQSTTTASTTQAVTSKLSVGVLKLEGSALAITSAQAQDLLFLWKGVKTLGADKSSSSLEIAALYDQIAEAMTADQVAAIDEMEISTNDISALMAEYGVSVTSGTTQAKSQSLTSTNFSGGDMGGPGGGSPDIMIISGGGMPGSATSSSSSSTQSAVKKVSTTTTQTQTDLNVLFADAVIQMLQKRAAS